MDIEVQEFRKRRFIEKAKDIHGHKFDYTNINYVDPHTNISIYCNSCKVFYEQSPTSHLNCYGCNTCHKYVQFLDRLDNFLQKATIIHKNRYEYDVKHVKSLSYDKINIKCPIHSWFKQRGSNHLEGKGCPKCNLSKGEMAIKNWLTQHNIFFEEQKKFDGCELKQLLRFDFYIPILNLLLEFNGIQHDIPSFTQKSFHRTQKSDKIKQIFAFNNKFNFLAINWKNLKQINEILELIFKEFGLLTNR